MEREKRSSPRAQVALDVEIETASRRWRGRSADLSMAGLSLDLEDPPLLGSELKLHFELPGESGKVEALAVPIWVNAERGTLRVGLRFERFLQGYVELGDFLVQFQGPA